jgi:hypothetical protein
MEKVKKYINDNKSAFLIRQNVNEKDKDNAEKILSLKFDSSYSDYLLSFGCINYASMETIGLGIDESSYFNVIKATTEVRNYNETFPKDAVVFEDIGENNYVIYIMDKGVFHWATKKNKIIKKSLAEYLLMRFNEENI